MSVCCGGIIGMGETEDDRLRMLEVLCSFDPPPESVPINCLVPMPGTPLEHCEPVDTFELVRLIATTRIALPKAKVRLSAGRNRLSREAQALCYFAGANSIFYGDKLLTASNPAADADRDLLRTLDLQPQIAFCPSRATCMKIAIGSDHAGFNYKQRIIAYLKEKGHEVVDFGTHSRRFDRLSLVDHSNGRSCRQRRSRAGHRSRRIRQRRGYRGEQGKGHSLRSLLE